jgi:hypothetical protein
VLVDVDRGAHRMSRDIYARLRVHSFLAAARVAVDSGTAIRLSVKVSSGVGGVKELDQETAGLQGLI